MNNKKISLWQLLTDQSIQIPIIQRDFAQGREGNEHLRARFLKSLKDALDAKKELVLDFVYGSDEKSAFHPLDGQQRITTLWLLHWYIALRANQLKDASECLCKFTYETRISSREFCQELCNPDNLEGFDENGTDIVSFIEKQTWFYSAWKQDPTIQSMLRMLGGSRESTEIVDGIEKLFDKDNDFREYWKALTSEDPVITFYYLSLKDFGLSDDLYIKMNARGKQLTAFENFKADLIGYISQQAQKNQYEDEQKKWMELLDAEKGIPIKLDTTWADLFWEYRSNDDQIDDIYFAFLNRFFLNHKLKHITDENDGYYSYLTNKGENDTLIQYKGIEPYLWKRVDNISTIDYQLFEDLNTIMENYNASRVEPKDFTCAWNPDFRFIPNYNDDKVTSINQVERVVFYAICKYFKEGKVEENTNKKSLKQWMRVVWNIVSTESSDGRQVIRNISEMQNAIKIIDVLDSHDVYSSMRNKVHEDADNDSLLIRQFKEEVFKCNEIKFDAQWEEKFTEAEKYAFFNGCIRFLLRDKDWEWTTKDFDEKWKNAQEFFDQKGVEESYREEARLLRAFLFHLGEEEAMKENNFIFDHTKETWRNRILVRRTYSEAVHKILTRNLSIEDRAEDGASYKALYSDVPLIKHIADELSGCRIRWIHARRSIYPSRRQGIMFDEPSSNFYRNAILSKCKQHLEFLEWQEISDCAFFRGWDIRFKYTDDPDKNNYSFFEYNSDNVVYLMEEDWSIRATDSKGKEKSFEVEEDYSMDEFTKELNDLIIMS